MDQKLDRLCKTLGPDVARLAQRLVDVRSYSFDEERMADQVQEAFESLDYDLVFRDDVGNVVAVLVGSTEGPILLLTSPMDTARPQDAPGADRPHSSKPRRGSVHGIGAAACKCALAAQVFSGQVLHRTKPFFHGSLVVATTVAEHDGCGIGTTHLLRQTLPRLGLKPSLIIRGEPTGLDLRNYGSGHGEILVRVGGSNEEAVTSAVNRVVRRLTTTDLPTVSTQSDVIRVSRPERSRSSVVPFEARMTIACQIQPGRTIADCIRWIQEAGNLEHAGLTVSASVLHERRELFTGAVVDVAHWAAPWSTDPADPVVRRAREALQSSGWSQAHFRGWSLLRRPRVSTGGDRHLHQVPTLSFGPGRERPAGAPCESVSIETLGRGMFGNAVLVRAVLESPAWMVISAG